MISLSDISSTLERIETYMEKKYKVAGYLRLSVEDGDKDVSDSIASQKSIINKKVEELGEDFEIIDEIRSFGVLAQILGELGIEKNSGYAVSPQHNPVFLLRIRAAGRHLHGSV